MNINEINVFGNNLPEEELPEMNDNEFEDDIFDECPVFGILEGLYTEPRPYGVTLSVKGIEEILTTLGYKVTEKDHVKYALKGEEKLSRSKEKRDKQRLICVFKEITERMAIDKFLKDWNNVYGTDGDSTEA